MKVNSIHLSNYKAFDDVTINLEGKSTVFYGVNGVGKSSILRAVNLLFSNIINSIVKNRFKQGIKLEQTDVSYGRPVCSILADIQIANGNVYPYWRNINKKDSKRTHSKYALRELIEGLLPKQSDETDKLDLGANIPIFANYGTNRLVLDVPVRIRNKHNFDQLSCFEKAIENRIDFRTFFEWFRNQEDFENQKKVELSNFDYVDKSLQSVKKAVESMLDGFSNLRINRHPLSMVVTKETKNFRVEQLSDGEKCTLALFGDLARRLSIANPYMDDPLQGEGIVLIDEIELHMHPKWQRKVLPTLSKVFPNIQFIVTTHSPQVLGEIDDSYNVISLDTEDGHSVIQYMDRLDALDSNVILEDLMGTSSLSIKTQQFIDRIYLCIQSCEWDEAERLTDILDKISGGRNVEVTKFRTLIRRGRQRT